MVWIWRFSINSGVLYIQRWNVKLEFVHLTGDILILVYALENSCSKWPFWRRFSGGAETHRGTFKGNPWLLFLLINRSSKPWGSYFYCLQSDPWTCNACGSYYTQIKYISELYQQPAFSIYQSLKTWGFENIHNQLTSFKIHFHITTNH